MTAPMFAPPDQAADAVGGKMQRIAVSVPKELREQIDDFRFANRIASRAEAIRRLVEAGLEAQGRGGNGPRGRQEPSSEG
jgi:Arc/MetJ-type ribon-helix-helix transcriptional regulator